MSWTEKYRWLSSCAGLELHILPDNAYSGRLCSVSLEKNRLNIDKKSEAEGDLAAVLKQVPNDRPLALTLTGKGILIKKVARIEEITGDTLNKVFPNFSLETFYVQNFISGDYSFLALIRKDSADELVKKIGEAGIKLLTVGLGPFAVALVLGQINNYGEEIRFDGHLIQHNSAFEWEDYKYQPGATSRFPLKIDTEKIPERNLIAYATAFQLALFNRLSPIVIPNSITEHALAEFREEKKFKFNLSAVLAGLFVLLLVNFLVFSRYQAANEQLAAQAGRSSAGVENVKMIRNDLAEKEKQLRELGWNKGLSFAYLADRIGRSVPASITLNELSVNPERDRLGTNGEGEKYEQNIIRISGKTANPEAVNDWIYRLKDETWVNRVTLESFSPGNGNEDDSRQQFILKISI